MNDHIAEAQRLVDAITDQAQRDEDNYRRGFADAARIFLDHGHEIGYALAHQEMAAAWSALAAHVRALAGTPTHAELQQRRSQPGGDAYHAALQRRGGREYTGGPIDFDTGQPLQPDPQPARRDPWATLPKAPEAAA